MRSYAHVPVTFAVVALPPAVNLAGGFSWIWIPSMPLPVLAAVTEAGLLDAWVLLELLAASGVLGGLGVAVAAARRPALAATLLAAVSAISFAAALAGPDRLPLWYGTAYAAAAAIVIATGRRGPS